MTSVYTRICSLGKAFRLRVYTPLSCPSSTPPNTRPLTGSLIWGCSCGASLRSGLNVAPRFPLSAKTSPPRIKCLNAQVQHGFPGSTVLSAIHLRFAVPINALLARLFKICSATFILPHLLRRFGDASGIEAKPSEPSGTVHLISVAVAGGAIRGNFFSHANFSRQGLPAHLRARRKRTGSFSPESQILPGRCLR